MMNNDEITMTMSKFRFDEELAKASHDGFNKGVDALLSLIKEYHKSGLTPMQYYKSVSPKIPNACLVAYMNIIEVNWSNK